MRQSVLESFVGFTRDLEGAISWMYLDVLGYVTTGYGNLINTPAAATALPWRRHDGTYASRDDILAEWASVRSRLDMAPHGGGAFAKVTRLRLDPQGVTDLVRATMGRIDESLRRRYADFESWPACAQLACLSLAWACGSAYHFPQMDRALANRDFLEASREIEMTPEHNPGNHLEARNRCNEILMRNAQRVEAFHLDPSMLNWTSVIGISDRDTEPELVNPGSDPPPPLVQLLTPITGQENNAVVPTCYPRPGGEPPPDDAA